VLIGWASEPFAASPQWTDVSDFVRYEAGIQLQRGRQDNISQIAAGRVTLTLDNSDGRFTVGRSASPYAPFVKIGRRIQVNVPDEAGVLHTRFDGLVTELPTAWEGPQAGVSLEQVQAADILAWLSRQPELLSWTQQEMLADNPVALWSLADTASVTSAADQAGQGALPLQVVSQGDGTGAAAAGSGVPLAEIITGTTTAQQQVTQVTTFTTPGPVSWQAPLGTIVKTDVACVAGGAAGTSGSGTNNGGASGNGGEYAEEPALAVTPSSTYTGTVGAVGVPPGGTGGDTTFTGDSVTVTAHGSGSGSSNTVHHSGGAGVAAGGGTRDVGGGGGSSGGTYQAGNGGNGPAAGVAVTGAGAGGAGDSNGAGASPGSAPGGGGGGGFGTASTAGASGGAGQITITVRPSVSALLTLVNPRGQTAIAVWVTPAGHLQLASTSGYGTRNPAWTTVDAGIVPATAFHLAITAAPGGVTTLYVNNAVKGTLTLPAGASYSQVTIGGAYRSWLGGWNGSAGLLAVYPAPLTAARIGVHYTAGTTGFAGSPAGTMISKIAAYTGLPAFWYTPPSGPADPSYGLTLVSYYDIKGQGPLAAMQAYETAEGGVLSVNAAGRLVFTDRAARYSAGTPLQPPFTLQAGQYQADTSFKSNDQYLTTAANYATARLPGGYPVSNSPARLDYGLYTQNAGTLTSPQAAPFTDAAAVAGMYSTDDIMDAGQWAVNVFGQPVPRVPSVTADLLTLPAAEFSTAAFYACDIGTAVQLAGLPSQAPDATGLPLGAYHVIEGINETLGIDAHTCQLYTSPLAQNAAWIPGDTLLGVLDSTAVTGRSQAPAAAGPPYTPVATFAATLNRTGSAGAQDMRTLTVNAQNRLTPPLLVARQAAAQTLTATAGQAVTFDTLLADTAGGMATTAAYTVPAGYAGYYWCAAVVQAASGTAGMGGLAAWFSATLAGSSPIPATTGTANAPAAFTNLASVSVPGGTYTVTWSVTLSGTVSSADANNFRIILPGAIGVYSVNPGAAGTYPQEPLTFTTPAGTIFLQTGTSNATAGSVYSETMTGPPAASRWHARATPYVSGAYTAVAISGKIGPCTPGDTIQVIAAAAGTPAAVPLGTADGGSMLTIVWEGYT
jgi:hypothetical protein